MWSQPGDRTATVDLRFAPDGKTVHVLRQTAIESNSPFRIIRRSHRPRPSGAPKPRGGYAVSPDGKWVADYTSIWSIETKKTVVELESVAPKPPCKDGLAGSSSLPGALISVRRVSRMSWRRGVPTSASVRAAAFSGDSRRYVMVADALPLSSRYRSQLKYTQVIQVWDTASGKVTAMRYGHTAPVWAVAFSPSGDTLYTASADMTVLVWPLGGSGEGAAEPK